MGETIDGARMSFNGALRVEISDDHSSSDGGALALREMLEASGLCDFLSSHLTDHRNPKYILHELSEMLRAVIIQRGQGWIDLADTDLLREDPVLALACSDGRGMAPVDQARASQPTLSRLLAQLGRAENIGVLQEGLMRFTEWRLRSERCGQRPRTLMLDVDGVPIDVHGEQGGSAFSNYYKRRTYQPLIASIAETGDLLGALLRDGCPGPAQDADTWIPALVDAMEGRLCREVIVRFDAGFTGDAVLRTLDEREIPYLGRLAGNKRLDELAQDHLRRPAGRPPNEPREWAIDLTHQAGTWAEARRLILVVKEREDDLFLDHFWIVTSLSPETHTAYEVVDLYRRRGKAEAHFGELKSVLQPHLSCTSRGCATVEQVLARNEANLLLSIYAYQVMHAVRRLLERMTQQGWSLSRLREQVLKVAARVTVHARQICVRLPRAARHWWQVIFRGLHATSPYP